MTENNQVSKRVHPFRWAEEWAQNPVKAFDVKPFSMHPFMTAQFSNNAGKAHPFSTAQCFREEN